MDTDRYVGERAHLLMWQLRRTQKDLARVLGVTQSTVSKKMRGDVPWTVAELVAAADFLGVAPVDLLPRVDSNHQPAGYRSGLVVAA